MEIAGKTIVITGGGSGMGEQTALYLSQRGARIAIIDVDQETAYRVAAKINGVAATCDVADPIGTENALKQITEKLGPLHVCINCAGIAPAKRIISRNGPMPLEDFTKVISVNLIGTFNMMRLAADIMAKQETIDNQEKGVIINTASIAAYEGQIGQSAYSASKGGVCALTLPAARELAQFNIRVMTIAPGLVLTPLLEGLPESVQETLMNDVPFPHRFGAPLEFAMLAAHIIENSYLNGEVIRLDGALRMPPK